MASASRANDRSASPERDREHLISVGPVEVLPDQLLVVIDGRRLWLRELEMDVLEVLAANAGRLLLRGRIFEAVWGRPLRAHDRSVDVQIARLRSKLAAVAPGWTFIHTHFGEGYRFEPEVRTKAQPGANA